MTDDEKMNHIKALELVIDRLEHDKAQLLLQISTLQAYRHIDLYGVRRDKPNTKETICA